METLRLKLDKLKQTKKTVEYQLEDTQYNHKKLKLKNDTIGYEIETIENEISKLEHKEDNKVKEVYSKLLKEYFNNDSFIYNGKKHTLEKFVPGLCDIYPRCSKTLDTTIFSGYCDCCRYKNKYDVHIDKDMVKHAILNGEHNYDLSYIFCGDQGLCIKINNIELVFDNEIYPKKIEYKKEAIFYFI